MACPLSLQDILTSGFYDKKTQVCTFELTGGTVCNRKLSEHRAANTKSRRENGGEKMMVKASENPRGSQAVGKKDDDILPVEATKTSVPEEALDVFRSPPSTTGKATSRGQRKLQPPSVSPLPPASAQPQMKQNGEKAEVELEIGEPKAKEKEITKVEVEKESKINPNTASSVSPPPQAKASKKTSSRTSWEPSAPEVVPQFGGGRSFDHFILEIEGVFSARDCERIIGKAQEVDKKDKIWTNFKETWRNHYQLPFERCEATKEFTPVVAKRVAECFELYKETFKLRGAKGFVANLTYVNKIEALQLNYYPKSKKSLFHSHADNWDSSTALRDISFVIYLNTVDVGGETDFPDFNLKYKPKQGSVIMFPSYFTHAHAGLPLSSKSSAAKWIISGWLCRTKNNAPLPTVPLAEHQADSTDEEEEEE